MASGDNSSNESGSDGLPVFLGAAAVGAYLLIWELLKGNGCGPAGNSASNPVFVSAPFILPLISGLVVFVVGSWRDWQPRTLAIAVVTVIGIAAVGEFFVFMLEFGTHHCGE